MNIAKQIKLYKQINKRILKWQGIDPEELKKSAINKMREENNLKTSEPKNIELERELKIDISAITIVYCMAKEIDHTDQKILLDLYTEWMAEAQETNENLDNGNTERRES